jgi:hypothetical protein
MNDPTIVVKVTHVNPNNKSVTRRIPIDKDIKFNEFHNMVFYYFKMLKISIIIIFFFLK